MATTGPSHTGLFQVAQDAAVARGLIDTTGFAQRVQLLLQQAQRFDLMMNGRDPYYVIELFGALIINGNLMNIV